MWSNHKIIIRLIIVYILCSIFVGNIEAQTFDSKSVKKLEHIRWCVDNGNLKDAKKILDNNQKIAITSSNDTIAFLYHWSNGYYNYAIGNYKKAIEEFVKSEDWMNNHVWFDCDTYITAMHCLAESYFKQSLFNEAELTIRRALISVLEDNCDETQNLYKILASIYEQRGDTIFSSQVHHQIQKNAVELFANKSSKIIGDSIREAYKMYDDYIKECSVMITRDDETLYIGVLEKQAGLMRSIGIDEEAIPFFRKVLSEYERYFPKEILQSGKIHSDYLGILVQLSVCFIHIKGYDDGISCLTKAEKLSNPSMDEIPMSYIYSNLGRAFYFKNDYHHCMDYLEKASEIQLKIKGVISDKLQQYINDCRKKL